MVVLPAPVGPTKRHGLARLRDQVDALQHRGLWLVREAHPGQFHAAGRDLQRPGVLGFAHPRLLVQQLEDALGAGDRRLHLSPHHGDGLHRLEEAAYVLQEGDDHADADQLHAGQHAAVGQHHGDADRADDVHGRRERGGQRLRADVGVAVGAVELPETRRVPALTIERLRHAGAGDVLLQFGADAADGLAGLAEGDAGAPGEHGRGEVHQRQQREAGQGQPPVERQHADQDRDQQQDAGGQPRQAHAHRAVDHVGVVGQPRHQVAGLVVVEVGERQRMYLGHDLAAHAQQQPLSHRRQGDAADGAGEPAGDVARQHQQHRDDQHPHRLRRVRLTVHERLESVDRPRDVERPQRLRARGRRRGHQHQQQRQAHVAQVAEQPQQRLPDLLGLPLFAGAERHHAHAHPVRRGLLPVA